MKITPIKTEVISNNSKTIFKVLDRAITKIKEKSIVAIASKIVSLCEGSFIKKEEVRDKDSLVAVEADFYIPRPKNREHSVIITIKNGVLSATAGIDESNADGCYVLWPKDPYRSANKIREHLKSRYQVKNLGVIITDSKTIPSRCGTIGFALAYSGIKPLKKYIGQKDLFGRKMKATFANLVDALAAASVAVIGEGQEQTPIAIVEDFEGIEFCDQNPSKEEIDSFNIRLEDDLYYPFLSKAEWKKGGGGYRKGGKSKNF